MSNALAVFFALASALVIAWGTVVRHRIAMDADNNIMRTAMKQPLWWVGTFAAVAAYGLQIVALGFGTLLIVQPVLVLSLMFTLPLAAWYSRRRMAGVEVFWSVALTIAVGVLVVLGRPLPGSVRPELGEWLSVLSVGVAAMVALALIGQKFKKQRALALGTVCGIIYGYVAVLSKAVVDIFVVEGLVTLLGSWQLYGLILAAGTGTVVQQYSFHAGPLKQSLPAMTIVEPIVAFSLGYLILGEHFQVSTAAGWAGMGAALVIMCAATVVLSQRPVGSSPNSKVQV